MYNRRKPVERKTVVEKILDTKLTTSEWKELNSKFFRFCHGPYEYMSGNKVYSKTGYYSIQDIKDYLEKYRQDR